MEIKTTSNRVLIAADGFLRSRCRVSNRSGKNILIVFQQAFGDALVLQDSLAEYIKLFSGGEGYPIKLLAQIIAHVEGVL